MYSKSVQWMNYHHLFYFWTIAKEGSVAAAATRLRLAQPTISGQIRALEESLGEKLFQRSGRGLALTEEGRIAFKYANEIFLLGTELHEVLKGRPTGRPLRLHVGVADVVPKLVAYRLLEAALHLPEPVQIVCREDKPDRLLADLAIHNLDIVIADAPVGPSIRVRAFNHLLGECGISFFATPALAKKCRKHFPKSLNGTPMLLPTDNTALRSSLDQWMATHKIRPVIAGEFEDSALLSVFGQTGMGVFVAPSIIEPEVKRQYQVEVVGRVRSIRERFFVISVERKLTHPAVLAILETAKREIGR